MESISLLTLPFNLPTLQCPVVCLLCSPVSPDQCTGGHLIGKTKAGVPFLFCFEKDFFGKT